MQGDGESGRDGHPRSLDYCLELTKSRPAGMIAELRRGLQADHLHREPALCCGRFGGTPKDFDALTDRTAAGRQPCPGETDLIVQRPERTS